MKWKILVTGANGQLGSEIKDLSANSEHLFFFTDIDQLDMSSGILARFYLKEISPDYIINCAAYTGVDQAESDEAGAIKGNVSIPGFIVAYAKKRGTKIIHISTDYVFSGAGNTPLLETDQTGPNSVYGRTKLEGEKMILSHDQSLVIRTSWLYSSYGKNFVKTMVRLMNEKEELGIVDDQKGTPTYARDLAAAILHIIGDESQSSDTFTPGIYHYSNEGIATWYELALEIKNYLGSSCNIHPIETKDYPLPSPRPMYSVLSKEKIKKDFSVKLPFWKDSLALCLQKITANK
jgi:dTDP-4-dehydrorhamnose reductase